MDDILKEVTKNILTEMKQDKAYISRFLTFIEGYINDNYSESQLKKLIDDIKIIPLEDES